MHNSVYTRPNKPRIMDIPTTKEAPERVPTVAPELVMVDRSTECFVTPASVVDLMLDYARLSTDSIPAKESVAFKISTKWKQNLKVLEPSAGTGAIAIRAKELYPEINLEVFELSVSLQNILKGAGFNLCGSDFLEFNGSGQYDRVLMNPPFSKLQDIDHVRKAYECLAPDGRLVAIMGAGAFFNSRNKAKEFRDWLDGLDSEYFDLPKDSFKESGTLANSKLVIIDK